jgi:hypothetical protein
VTLKAITPESPAHEIEEYAQETHKAALEASKERRLQGELNWLYYLNKQDQHIKDGSVGGFWGHERYPYRTQNFIRNNLDTQVGRQLKDLPDVEAVPTSAAAIQRGAAQIAQDLLEYWAFEHNDDRENTRVCLWGYLSGYAGFKVTFDPETDSIKDQPLKAWEFISDPDAESVERGRWVTFIDYVSEFDAFAMARERMEPEEADKLTADDFQEEEYKPGITGKVRKGVKIEERWEIPHPRLPEGLYALFVGGKLVEAKAYPYMLPAKEGTPQLDPVTGQPAVYEETGEPKPLLSPYLPVVVWSPGQCDDGPWGSSPVDDAVERQRLHNENLSHIANLTRISADLRRYGNKEVLDRIITGKNQNVECADPSQIPRWDEPPRISPALMASKDAGATEIANLLGVDQQGNDSKGSSARFVAYVEQIDSYKLTGAHRSFIAMVEAKAELRLKLAQVFLSARTVYTMPHGDTVKEIAFRSADLNGVTVRIEPRAGKDKYSASKAQALAERAAAGLADPEQAARALETGQGRDSFEVASERIVAMELEEVRMGMPPSLEADPTIAVPYLRNVHEMLLAQGDEQGAEAAKQLAMAYGQQMQQQQQQQPGQQGRPKVQAPQTEKPISADILPGGPPLR